MNKKKLIFYALCLVFSFILTGCSQVTELSSDQEDMIAAYCAKTVAKFNKKKVQGVINLRREEPETEEVSEEPEVPESPDTEGTEVELEAPEEDLETATEETVSEEDLANLPSATISEALQLTGLTFVFKNAAEVGYYSMGGYYDISPAEGNDFLVLTFDVRNDTGSDIVLNIPSTMAKFKVSVGGTSNTADNTILLNDMSNFSGTIAAGSSEELVLLFQFKPEYLTDLSTIRLQLVQGDAQTNIVFEG